MPGSEARAHDHSNNAVRRVHLGRDLEVELLPSGFDLVARSPASPGRFADERKYRPDPDDRAMPADAMVGPRQLARGIGSR
jgi:hypothetical protein